MTRQYDLFERVRFSDTGNVTVRRINAIGEESVVELGTIESSIILFAEQFWDEATNPSDLTNPLDPYARAYALNLQQFTQGRIRYTIANTIGTSGVEAELQYSVDFGGAWATLLQNTIDCSQASGTTDWEALPSAAVGPAIFNGLQFHITGTGSATFELTAFLDVRA